MHLARKEGKNVSLLEPFSDLDCKVLLADAFSTVMFLNAHDCKATGSYIMYYTVIA